MIIPDKQDADKPFQRKAVIKLLILADLRFGGIVATFHRQMNGLVMDTVFIRDLRIETVIGIYDWEREIHQTVCLDLEMATDIRRAAQTDSIDDTLDYKSVAKRLIQFVGESEFQLVETLAERVAEIVLKEFDVPQVKLRLSKPGAVTGSQDVGVIIERSQ